MSAGRRNNVYADKYLVGASAGLSGDLLGSP